MKIIIFGAGAIGTYVGASLILASQEVHFLERQPSAGILGKQGITMRKKSMVQKVSGLNIHSSLNSIGNLSEFDLGILAVKSYDTKDFINSMSGFLKELPAILSLQNGVENENWLAETLGWEKVIGGSVTTAIGRSAPGEITVEKLRGIGIAGSSPLVPQIVAVFNRAGLKARRYSNVPGMKWSKMLTNLPANASAAILNMLPAEVFADRDLFEMEMLQLREALSVMKAKGYPVTNLPGTPVRLLAAGCRFPGWAGQPLIGGFLSRGRGDKKPSFLLEIQNDTGKTEVGYLNGAVERFGKEMGIPTPVNTGLNNILQQMAEGRVDRQEFDHKPSRLLDLIDGKMGES